MFLKDYMFNKTKLYLNYYVRLLDISKTKIKVLERNTKENTPLKL